MSFGITFGSVGDLIAVGQIAVSLAKALSDSCGSAREYQTLIKELRNFDRSLLQVVAIWQNYQISPELAPLCTETMETVKHCQDTLRPFCGILTQKYGVALGQGASSSRVKAATMKLLWLKEKKRIDELRSRLQMSTNSIMFLTMVALGQCSRLDSATQLLRIRDVYSLLEDSVNLARDHKSQLQAIDTKLTSQADTSALILRNITDGFGSMAPVILEMNGRLGTVHAWVSSQNSIPSGVGVCWQQAPVTFEDARAYVVPVPLELIGTWKALHALLVERFQGSRAYRQVRLGDYDIQDNLTGKTLDRSKSFTKCVQPGQKVNMSIVFYDERQTSSCPRCGAPVAALDDAQVKCPDIRCGMSFQRADAQVHIYDGLVLDPVDTYFRTVTEELDTKATDEIQRVVLVRRDDPLRSDDPLRPRFDHREIAAEAIVPLRFLQLAKEKIVATMVERGQFHFTPLDAR